MPEKFSASWRAFESDLKSIGISDQFYQKKVVFAVDLSILGQPPSIVAVTSKREVREKTTECTRYFITSLDATNPENLGYIARADWGIENNLHWVLDYSFDEDSQRTRAGNSAANMAIIRHLALNMLKSEETAKVGMKTKRLQAGWDNDYLLKVLAESSCF